MSAGLNILYWALILGCIYLGFASYPIWTILVAGGVALVLFSAARPGVVELGWREKGLNYIVTMVGMNAALCAVLFGAGRLVAWIVQGA